MNISLVSLKDGSILIGKGKKTFLKEPDPIKPSWYTPDFFLENKTPWHTHETYEIVQNSTYEMKTALRGDAGCFKAMFDDVTIRKAVAYTSQPVKGFCWKSALTNLIEKASHYYLYGTEGILGATPEILFEIDNDLVKTVALAATAKDPTSLHNVKEFEEHEIVVEGIISALTPFGKVTVHSAEVVSYGNLYHLKKEIHLHAKVSFESLVKALHPTPALGAWPKEEGALWLKKWGKIKPRGRFGAPFGYVFPERKESRAFVAIRCIQWDNDQEEASLWAGAGITSKSSFAEEKEEVLQKLSNTAFLMGI